MYRSRHVAQGLSPWRQYPRRSLRSNATLGNHPSAKIGRFQVLLLDISKAYLHGSVIRNDIYVELSSQDAVDACARRCMTQERHRGAGNKNSCECSIESIGFRHGSTSSCACWPIRNRILEWKSVRITIEVDSRHEQRRRRIE